MGRDASTAQQAAQLKPAKDSMSANAAASKSSSISNQQLQNQANQPKIQVTQEKKAGTPGSGRTRSVSDAVHQHPAVQQQQQLYLQQQIQQKMQQNSLKPHTLHHASTAKSDNDISRVQQMTSTLAGIKITPVDSYEPDVADMMQKLEKRRKFNWKSPLMKDETYLIDVVYNGDESKLHDLQLKLNLSNSTLADAKSHEYLNHKGVTIAVSDGDHSPAAFRHDIRAKIQQQQQQPGPRRSSLAPPTNDQLNALNEYQRRTSTQNLSADAPVLPKRRKPNMPALPPKQVNKHLFKFNSCSTLFSVDASLIQPTSAPQHLEWVLKSVSHAILTHLERTYLVFQMIVEFELKNRLDRTRPFSRRALRSADILSEKLHPIWSVRFIPDDVLKSPEIMPSPTFDEVFTFLKQVFAAADLHAEVAIIALVYLERAMKNTKIALHGLNVFRAVLGAIMLASKIWDDQAVWNVDYKTIMPDLSLDGLHQMERWWLQILDFDVNVRRNVFAKYWFELHELSDALSSSGSSKSEAAKEQSSKDGASSEWDLKRTKVPQNQMNGKQKSIEKTNPLLHSTELPAVGLRKPLTERELARAGGASMYSQSKLRESFADALNAPANSMISMNSSQFLGSNHHASSRTISIHSSGHMPQSSNFLTVLPSHGSRALAVPRRMSIDSNVSTPLSFLSKHHRVPSQEPPLPTEPITQEHHNSTSSSRLKETVLSSFNQNVTDFGWGGSNLRRAKSDNLYTPRVPAASVL